MTLNYTKICTVLLVFNSITALFFSTFSFIGDIISKTGLFRIWLKNNLYDEIYYLDDDVIDDFGDVVDDDDNLDTEDVFKDYGENGGFESGK